MVRQAKWMSLIVIGLVLGWDQIPALSQQPLGQPKPIELAPGFRGDDTVQANDDSGDEVMDEEEVEVSDDDQNGDDDIVDEGAMSDDEAMDDEEDTVGAGPEIIRERHPNGSIKVERQVTQDTDGNYLNHGPWKMWDERGNPIAQGEFEFGNRTGVWIRWFHSINEAPLLSKLPYQQYNAPFVSQASFKNDQIDGAWTVWDGKQHKISHWEFREGQRHGASTWWYASGRKMREVQYRDGELDGLFVEWGPDNNVVIKDSYQQGRKLAVKTLKHPDGSKKSEGMYLFAKEVERTPDDWWSLKLQTTAKTGNDEKHGAWVAWHPSGQRQMEGAYEHDMQIGKFTWWHANGQKALEGNYQNGKQHGRWSWWYATGQKSISGMYAQGNPTGKWTWWKEDGKVAQAANLSHSEGVVVDIPRHQDPSTMPQAVKPRAGAPTQR